ncbi:selenocysteine lyase isoform X2 [Petromyzon marinus]|uniref:Selenocysteine lyase n=1 Tax=Petromyzon marinus TaxID=7757 RepID=A0AAJ7T458_PETMA|nr:selenocysteine lyase isoform X2 [Petromyzon marinus]
MATTETNTMERVYMDYNATTPLAPEVVEDISRALTEAWGNPSSSYGPGQKAKALICRARGNIASMLGGCPEDIIFTSGGTEANNLVLHTAVKHFWKTRSAGGREDGVPAAGSRGAALPHIIVSCLEHDSVRLAVDSLVAEGRADFTAVPASWVTGRVEVDQVLAAIRPTTCIVSIMLANNETGIIMFYGPRVGALCVRGLGAGTPLVPMLFGGGQERNFRPGTENTPMIAGLGKAAELVCQHLDEYERHMRQTRDYLEELLLAEFGPERLHFNGHFSGSDRLPNTCNVSILGPCLQGHRVLAEAHGLLASVGAACHSGNTHRPSHVLLQCGVPEEVALNAVRLSVGRETSRRDVERAVSSLRAAVTTLTARGPAGTVPRVATPPAEDSAPTEQESVSDNDVNSTPINIISNSGDA